MSVQGVIGFADLISAFFGLMGALVLAWPAIGAVRAKRNWEQHAKLKEAHKDDAVTSAALEGMEHHVERSQLGDSRNASLANAVGFSSLAVSFLFLSVAAIARLLGSA